MSDNEQLARLLQARKRIRIVSDGTPTGTVVYDQDGRQVLQHVIRRIDWVIEPQRLGVATIECFCDVDIVGIPGPAITFEQ